MLFSGLLLQQLSPLFYHMYLLHLTLFHKSAIISTFPSANAFYIMIPPQSIAHCLIFWISVSIMWRDHFSKTSLFPSANLHSLDNLPNSKILFFHSFAQLFINYSVSLHTLVWCVQTHAIISNFTSMKKEYENIVCRCVLFPRPLTFVFSLHFEMLGGEERSGNSSSSVCLSFRTVPGPGFPVFHARWLQSLCTMNSLKPSVYLYSIFASISVLQ